MDPRQGSGTAPISISGDQGQHRKAERAAEGPRARRRRVSARRSSLRPSGCVAAAESRASNHAHKLAPARSQSQRAPPGAAAAAAGQPGQQERGAAAALPLLAQRGPQGDRHRADLHRRWPPVPGPGQRGVPQPAPARCSSRRLAQALQVQAPRDRPQEAVLAAGRGQRGRQRRGLRQRLRPAPQGACSTAPRPGRPPHSGP